MRASYLDDSISLDFTHMVFMTCGFGSGGLIEQAEPRMVLMPQMCPAAWNAGTQRSWIFKHTVPCDLKASFLSPRGDKE